MIAKLANDLAGSATYWVALGVPHVHPDPRSVCVCVVVGGIEISLARSFACSVTLIF